MVRIAMALGERACIWTTSCWQLPEARLRNGSIPLMGCDNGQETTGQLQYVGTGKITVAGQEQTCAHYRLLNKATHDLWYDGQERLVRHDWVADGHRTVLEMIRITRP